MPVIYSVIVAYLCSAAAHVGCVWVHMLAPHIEGTDTKRMLVVCSAMLAIRPVVLLLLVLALPWLKSIRVMPAVVAGEFVTGAGMALWATWFFSRSSSSE